MKFLTKLNMNHIFHVNNNPSHLYLWANFSSMSGGQLQKKIKFEKFLEEKL